MSKINRVKLVTPVVEVKYANIGKPNIKHNPDGVYSVDGIMDPAEPAVKALLERLNSLAQEAKTSFLEAEKDPAKRKKMEQFTLHTSVVPDTDKDGNETGKLVIRAKNAAVVRVKGKEPFTKTIQVFDAANKEMRNKNVGRGSRLKIAATVNPFVMPSNKIVGVTLWLTAVQVIDFKPFGEQDAASFGFAQEEGYAEEPSSDFDPATAEAPAAGADAGSF